MENLLPYIYLLAPGFIVILLNERIGSIPTIKHNNIDKILLSIIFSVPIVICNLVLLSLKCGELADINLLHEELKRLDGLFFYFLTSLLFAFAIGFAWNNFIQNKAFETINNIRDKHGRAKINTGANVWEDSFHQNDSQAIEVLLKDSSVYGSPINVSENISDERCLLLTESEQVEKIIKKYNIPVDKVYIDSKSGIAIKIYNSAEFIKAYKLDDKYCQ